MLYACLIIFLYRQKSTIIEPFRMEKTISSKLFESFIQMFM